MTLSPDDILERTQWDTFWMPDDVMIIDRPELRYMYCKSGDPMLNAVTRIRATDAELPALIQEVSEAHADVHSRWPVRDVFETPALKRALLAHGYEPMEQGNTRVIGVSDYQAKTPDGLVVKVVQDMEILRDCVHIANQAFTSYIKPSDEALIKDLKICTQPGSRVFRVVVYDEKSGEPLSSAGMTLFADLSFGFLWGGGTVPGGRGRGAYRAALNARIQKARELGLDYVGLWALTETSDPIVARMGFEKHGSVRFWERKRP
ncbi:hypothetical protein KAI87_06650 [Myxococcota bacterium]|nr:hypothetical protein [Myxococcota bacterium]